MDDGAATDGAVVDGTVGDGTVGDGSAATTGYVLGSGEPALARLGHLSRVYAEVTARWLDSAGLAPGMSVVDLGCGAGDVTEAVAARVGPTGRVVGIDNAAPPLESARRRAAAAGLAHVTYELGDMAEWRPPDPVDAVVGRLVLTHAADPVTLVTGWRDVVRPGGVVAFQDVVLTTRAAQPPLPLLTSYNHWLIETFTRLGRPVDMGLRLTAVFLAAGLPGPVLTAGAPAERGGDAVGWSIAAGDVASLLPHMLHTGVATEDEIGPATFERRLRQEAAEHDAVLINPLLVGAVARTPVRRPPLPRPRSTHG